MSAHLEPLSIDERPGDTVTALAKTGLVRASANADMDALAKHVPTTYRGVPVEYDVSYNRPGPRIQGYKYADLLTCCLWIAPCNAGIAVQHIRQTLDRPITPAGVRVFQRLVEHAGDKYELFHAVSKPHAIVVMPGSNVLEQRVIDVAKVDAAVSQGAWIKPHPVTHDVDIDRMRERWGAQVLPLRKQLYPLLRQASMVYGTGYSETAFASILFGLPFRFIEQDLDSQHASYADILRGLGLYRDDVENRVETLLHLLSWPESGFVSVFHDDPQGCIDLG